MNRDDLEHYVMGVYDGDVAALERELADDELARAIVADEARLELVLRDAAAAATFCAACDDLVRGARCDACGAAVRPGGYVVERVLVSNAHGRMYAARDVDGKQVALKELAFVQAPTLAMIAAFEREVKFLRALEHPGIPRFCASFEEGTGVHVRYYLAQELVAGESLARRLEDHWFDQAEILGIARQVLDVLVYLQGLSPMVIHRDIKPANLVVRQDGTIAVVDFGAAHVQGSTGGSTTVGTFGYMPIEQLAGEVDATTDLHALGASLLHLLTRREPWRILQSGLVALDGVEINISRPLRGFLTRLVAPDPRARFRSAVEARAALERVTSPPRSIGSVVQALPRPSLRVAVAAAAAVALGGLGMAGHALRSRRAARSWQATVVAQMTAFSDELCACSDRPCLDNVSARIAAWTGEPARSRLIDRGAAPPGLSDKLSVLRTKNEVCRTLVEARLKERAVAEASVDAPHAGTPTLGGDKYLWQWDTGRPIHDAVKAIAEACAVDVVVPGWITQSVSAPRPDLRCDRAFDVLLESTGLTYEVHDGPIVQIGHPTDFVRQRTQRELRALDHIVDQRLPSGRAVGLNVKQAPVRFVIEVLAGAADVHALVSTSVKATVTVHSDNLPWDRVLAAVLEVSELGYRLRDGNQLYIAPIEEIEADRDGYGLLELRAHPGTRVAIDGADIDVVAGRRLRLVPGNHMVKIMRDRTTTVRSLQIIRGATTTVLD